MTRSSSVSKLKKPSPQARARSAEITLSVPPGLVAALDEYAREHGVSRADAAHLVLYSAPQVASALCGVTLCGADVTLSDVVGP